MLDVLYEDNHLLVVNKPAGTLTQGDATGDLSLLEIAKKYVKEKYHKPGDVFLAPAHRLDRPVSGVLIFARTSKSAARLAAQFRERESSSLEKFYLAVLDGNLPPSPISPSASMQRVEHRLLIGDENSRTRVVAKSADGKNAALLYKIIATDKAQTLVVIKLLTGYKHQIRAQFSALGAPIIGDFKYSPHHATPLFDGHAIGLHALKITLTHPTQKTPLTIFAPPPLYFPSWTRRFTQTDFFPADIPLQ